MSLLDGIMWEKEFPSIWVKKEVKEVKDEEEKSFPFDGCDFCLENIFINEETLKFEMIVDTGMLLDGDSDWFEFKMEINYCPKCGLKLG